MALIFPPPPPPQGCPQVPPIFSKSCSNFLKKLLKSCSKTLKVAQKLPQNPKVAQNLLSILWCQRLINNLNKDLMNRFHFA